MIFLVKPFVADTTKLWTQQVCIFYKVSTLVKFLLLILNQTPYYQGLGVALALKQAQLNSILFNTDIQFDY